MKRILFILCLISYCYTVSSQIRDSRVHYYIIKDWGANWKSPVHCLYFEDSKLYHCELPSKKEQSVYSIKNKVESRRSDEHSWFTAVLHYKPEYSNKSRSTYYAENLQLPSLNVNDRPAKTGIQFISVSNDMSEYIETRLSNNDDSKPNKTYWIEVPASYFTDDSPRINKSFVNE